MDESFERFGRYLLLRELGRGGQGTVWLAEDTKLGREVAIKVLHAGPGSGSVTDREIARFRREAESASRLDHPNICALLDAGDVDGVPFLAFRHIGGETLVETIERSAGARRGEEVEDDHDSESSTDPSTRDGVQRIVHTFEKVARALHKAHETGLVHRDIKPGNIMLTADEGEPVILDFGLARDEIGDGMSLTHSGDLLGTPAYMSPEQLTAKRIPLDRRTDIYSLGSTLYECLTCQRPFTALTRAELYQQILSADPTPADQLNRQIPRDLRVVLDTAMEKDRNRRYQSALDFAEDLRRFRTFAPIRARPIGTLLRLRRWTQRHPTASVGVAGLIVALGLAVLLYLRSEEELRRTRARAWAGEAIELVTTDPEQALHVAVKAHQEDPSARTSSALQAALTSYRSYQELLGLPHTAQRATFSPTNDALVLIASLDQSARMWNTKTGIVERFDHGAQVEVTWVDFSPDGKRFVSASQDGKVRIWSVSDSKAPLKTIEPIPGVSLSRAVFVDEKRLLIAPGLPYQGVGDLAATDVQLWSTIGQGKFVRRYPHPKPITSMAVDSDGKYMLTGTQGDDQVRLWDLDQPDEPQKSVHHGAELPILCVAFAPDGETFLSSGRDHTGRHWHKDGTPIEVLRNHRAYVNSVAMAPDGRTILTSCSDQAARLFDRSGNVVERFLGHSARIVTAEFSPDGHRIATCSEDGTVRVWTPGSLATRVFRYGLDYPVDVQLTKDDRRLIAVCRHGGLFVTDVESANRHQFGGAYHSLRLLSDRHALCYEKTKLGVVVVDLETGEEVKECLRIGLYTFGQFQLQWSFASDLSFAAVCGDNRLVLINLDKWTVRDLINRSPFEVPLASASFRKFGSTRTILVADRNGNLVEYELDGSTLRGLPKLDFAPLVVKTAPCGQRFACSGRGGIAAIYSSSGREIARLEGHTGDIWCLAYSRDGKQLATAGIDGRLRVHDSASGVLQLGLYGQMGYLLSARFSSDGKYIVTASGDHTARRHLVDLEQIKNRARAVIAKKP